MNDPRILKYFQKHLHLIRQNQQAVLKRVTIQVSYVSISKKNLPIKLTPMGLRNAKDPLKKVYNNYFVKFLDKPISWRFNK